MTEKKHLLHIRSNHLNSESNGPKLPLITDIEYGEIAVNYADGYETLSLKNSSDKIITISADNIIKKQIDLKANNARVDEINEFTSESFEKVKNSCGFNETMSYIPKNELIQDCTTLSDAIELVAEKVNSVSPSIITDNETIAEVISSSGTKVIGIPNRPSEENLGYVILKKNKSLFEQITQANTIYEIRYAYDLEKETLIIPENCVLKFEGGLIINGVIIGNNTIIEASCTKIFESIEFKTPNNDGEGFLPEYKEKSLFNIEVIPVEWFGATSKNFDCENPTWTKSIDDLEDSSDAINEALKLSVRCGAKAILTGKMYKISKTVTIPSHGTLYISNRSIIVAEMNGSGIMEGESEPRLALSPNEYIPTNSMAVAIELHGYSGRIEGHGQLLLSFSTYTIGVLVKGKYFNDIDVTLNAFVDLRIIGGIKGNTAPDITDTFGEGEPLPEAEGTYYFNKTNKKMYRKQGNTWSYWKNADARYNTSFRADLTQTGSDYRLLGTNFNIWDIYGFRGIEVIQSGSCWYNDGIWNGTIGNKCSNYISFFGSGIAQHDMTSMFYQSGGEQNDSSPICYCEAHGIHLGRAWDLGITKTSSIRFIFTEQTYNCSAQWVDNYKYIKDLGKNNSIVSYSFNNNNPDNYGAFQYTNLWEMRTPKTFYYFTGIFKAEQFYEDINDFNKLIGWTDKNDFSKNMFDCSPLTFDTLIDTDNNLYASGWWMMPNRGYNGWTRAKHAALQIDFDINEMKNNNAEIYVTIPLLNIDIKLINGNNGETANNLNRQKIIIPLWDNGYKRGQTNIIFYTKTNTAGQKLRIYNIKFLVDAYDNINPMNTIFDNKYGETSNIPNAAPSGHIYYNTEINTTLINKGNSEESHFDSIFSPYIIEHNSDENIISNLEPNVYHKWGEINSLTINSFKTRNTKSIDEYMIEFKSGNIPTTLTITDVKWIGETMPIIKPNTLYQISIINKIAVIGGV